MSSAVWQPQDISKGSFTFEPGQRYAVLASVGQGTSLASIRAYVQKQGFEVTYLCEILVGSANACANRDQFNVDDWLKSITASPRSGERWVYAEGNFTGSSPWQISTTDSFPKTIIVTYSIADVFEAVAAPQVPEGTTAPSGGVVAPSPVVTPPAAASSGSAYVVGGAAVVAVGVGLLFLFKGKW